MVSDPLSRVSQTIYNSEGELHISRNAENEEVEHVYFDSGELYGSFDGEDKTTIYQLDKNNNRDAMQNRRGQVYLFTHDANDRQLTLKTPLGKTTTITYTRDGNGNPTQITEGAQTVTRTFDERNRIKSYTDANGNTISYKFDGNNNLVELTYPGGTKKVTYTYNAHNRLKTVTDWNGKITTYSYDLNGRKTQVDLPNGTSRRFVYDAAGQLKAMSELDATGVPLAYCMFTRDNVGRITGETTYSTPQPYTPPAFDAQFYDADNRIQVVNFVATTSDDDGNMTAGPLTTNGNVAYTFDSRNRLLSAGNTSYSYDPENNLISVDESETASTFAIDPNTGLSKILTRTKGGQTTCWRGPPRFARRSISRQWAK